MRLCVHCDRFPVSRPRGLCWSCYYRPGVRELYPTHPWHPGGRRGIAHVTPRNLSDPTDARPGSVEKVRVLMERAANNQVLFHPDDAVLDGYQPGREAC
jgi:hypothetical protein